MNGRFECRSLRPMLTRTSGHGSGLSAHSDSWKRMGRAGEPGGPERSVEGREAVL